MVKWRKPWNGKESKRYLRYAPIIIALSFLLVFVIALFAPYIDANADEASTNPYGEPMKIRCTCYKATGNPCFNGQMPIQGLSVAGKEEWLGKACIMYQVNEDGSLGDMIGIFQFTDTGYGMDVPNSDKGTIQLGRSIDVHRDTLSGCREWIKQYGDYVYIQVIDAKG